MRTTLAASAVFGLGLALSTAALAQENRKNNGNQGRSGPETIRGVVAAVTAEGEMVIDYRTKQAVMAQAAYLTIVGSPDQSRERASGDRSGNQRDNIYLAWISPRTKVYQASGESGRSDQKQETTLDRLEVGDRVEVQFSPREDSGSNSGSVQTEQMRRKHGRERTYVGDATAITILPPRSHSSSSSNDKEK